MADQLLYAFGAFVDDFMTYQPFAARQGENRLISVVKEFHWIAAGRRFPDALVFPLRHGVDTLRVVLRNGDLCRKTDDRLKYRASGWAKCHTGGAAAGGSVRRHGADSIFGEASPFRQSRFTFAFEPS